MVSTSATILRSASLAIALAGCSGGSEIGTPAPPRAALGYDAVWTVSTHNSYWVDRGFSGDLFASGTAERFADQLLFDHARGVEIDIHPDPDVPGGFAVYHTTPGNGLCGSLAGCLGLLRAFHYAEPRHEALHVTLELKALIGPNFDAAHTIEDLDHALESELGAALYRPADLLRRCDDVFAGPRRALGLAACVRELGWPEAAELRGKILVSTLGNWDGLPGARATRDWVDYALHGDIRDRAAFPMASSWQLDREALSGPIHELVTQEDLDAASLQSVFLQVEDTADPRLAGFLARGGVARVDGAVTAMDQEARIALGAQLLQSDSPWIQAADHGASQPSRRLHGAAAIVEPGVRFTLHPASAGAAVHAYGKPGAWEATIASGADAQRIGCLRAESAAGDESIAVCRTKIAADRGDGTTPGKPSPDAERMILRIEICHAGTCATKVIPSIDPAPGGPGDLLSLAVTPQADGSSCAEARSAAAVNPQLAPEWAGAVKECFPVALTRQGLALPAGAMDPEPATFFGVRRDGAAIQAADFAGVLVEPAGQPSQAMPGLLEDGSTSE